VRINEIKGGSSHGGEEGSNNVSKKDIALELKTTGLLWAFRGAREKKEERDGRT